MIKLLAHTALDAYDLSNAFIMRFMSRSGLLPKYLGASLRFLTESLGIPPFRPQDIDAIMQLIAESAPAQHGLTMRYWHAVVEEWPLEPPELPELRAKLLEASLRRLEKIEAILETPTKPQGAV